MLRTARLIVLAVLSGGIFAVPCGIYAQSAPRTVSGTVTDAATGEPLIGATVQVKGVTIGTTTDLNGMFSINLPANRKTLLFSYVGYEAQEIAVGRENYLNVALKQDANALDEVVVVGYGQQKKGMLVSSVPVYCFDGFCEGAGFIGHVAVVGIEPHLGVRNLHDDRDRRFFPCGCECGRQTAKSC